MRYIYCHPLFDERKCGHRFSYQLSEVFKKNDLELERFDYSGTGEAKGEFSNVTFDSLINDLRMMAGDSRSCLIGTRLGASVALEYCRLNEANVHCLVLIEPVVNGQRYVDYLLRKQHLKDMMTGNRNKSLEEYGYINIEGYKTNIRFIDQIKPLKLLKAKNIKADKILIAQVTSSRNVCREYKTLAENNKNRGLVVLTKTFDVPIFWERIPETDYCNLNRKIMEFCR